MFFSCKMRRQDDGVSSLKWRVRNGTMVESSFHRRKIFTDFSFKSGIQNGAAGAKFGDVGG